MEECLKAKDVLVVREFLEVFPEDLPRLPHDIEIEFVIDLVPGISLISQALHWMATTKLEELKVQLHELLDKRLIHPSCPP